MKKRPLLAKGSLRRLGYCELLNLLYDSLESLGVVNGEVSEHLAVDLDTSLVQSTHKH